MKAALYKTGLSTSTRTKLEERRVAKVATMARCRGCAGEGLRTILNMGPMPLANALLTEDRLGETEPRIPLELAFCPECSLVQITETVPAAALFRHYVYFSSFSETVLRESRELARRVREMRELDTQSRVMEIASNDGYLLKFYQEAGIPVLGIEPAENIARVARERGVRTVRQFFGRELAWQLQREGLVGDVVHANNVLAHVDDLDGFLDGLRMVMKAEGVAVIEVPYVRDLIEQVEFDTIYHEHLSYFSLSSLEPLFEAHGLMIADVERLTVHGGSLRLFVEQGDTRKIPSRAVERMMAEERECGIANFEFYAGFAEKVFGLKQRLTTELRRLKTTGKRIAGYGASAKGATLLNYFGIGAETLDFVVDRSTVKQGLFMPGTHLEICGPEKLVEAMPEYVLVLTWNFADEILAQQREYRGRGGKFIVPIPELRVI
jgi:SAM-dependent methyltransferase